MLIPAFKATGADLRSVAFSSGVSGVHAGRKFGFAETTTDSDRLFADASTAAVVITTRHDNHARFVLQGLRADKAVFVEKPLCLTLGELGEIADVISTVGPAGMPGPGARDGERAGQTEAAMPDSALPSMALDSGFPAGMTWEGAGMTPPLLMFSDRGIEVAGHVR